MKQLFSSPCNINLHELVGHLVGQETILGSTIKLEDDDDNDLYGFIVLTPFLSRQKTFQTLAHYLLQACNIASMKERLMSLVQSDTLGWLISERMINLPSQIAPPMYRLLLEELLQEETTYTHILMILKAYRDIVEETTTTATAKTPEMVYFNGEEELFIQNYSTLFMVDYQFQLETASSTPSLTEESMRLETYRRVIVFETKHFPTLVDALNLIHSTDNVA
jgi:protein BCP1